MSRLILHIGSPKTGTTALQNYLYGARHELLERYGVLYPDCGLAKIGKGHHNITNEFRHGSRFLPERGGMREFIELAKATDAPVTVLSTEGLFAIPRAVQRRAELMKDFSVEIAVYLRRQDLYLESAYNQLARLGRMHETIMEVRKRRTDIGEYRRLLRRWKAHLPEAKLVVTPFEKAVIGGDIATDFLRRFVSDSATVEQPVRRNTRVGLKAIQGLYLVQRLGSEISGRPFVADTPLVRRVKSVVADNEIYDYTFLSAADAQRIVDESVGINRWLARVFPQFRPDTFFNQEPLVAQHQGVSAHGEEFFSPEERRALQELAREAVSRADSAARRKTTPAESTPQA